MDEVLRLFQTALSGLTCPATLPPGAADQESWVVYQPTAWNDREDASNDPHRRVHQLQLHVYSKLTDGTAEEIYTQAIALLKAAGVRIRSGNYFDYEMDTGVTHCACTCEYHQRLS